MDSCSKTCWYKEFEYHTLFELDREQHRAPARTIIHVVEELHPASELLKHLFHLL